MKDAIAKDQKVDGNTDSRMAMGGRIATVPDKYYAIVRKPEYRDPRGYILSANEGDFLTATKFVNIMIKSGLTAHRATAPFTVAGKQYPAGSYVFKGAQAFRPHLLDMFEPQDHPNDFQYPGGPPIPPYDSAGWTLAFQMGLKFDRILEAFDGPFEKIPDVIKPAPGKVTDAAGARRLRRQSQEQRRVHRRQPPAEGERRSVLRRRSQLPEHRRHRRDLHHRQADDEGDPRQGRARSRPQLHRGHRASRGRDLQADQAAHRPVGSVRRLDAVGTPALAARAVRVRLRARVPRRRSTPATSRRSSTCCCSPTAAFPKPTAAAAASVAVGGVSRPRRTFRRSIARISAASRIKQTVPQLKAFAEAGGVIVAFGGSAVLGHHLGLPVSDHLVEVAQDGSERPLPGTKYYIPGGVLQVAVDNTNPTAFGFDKKVDVFFDNSPVMELAPDAAMRGVKTVAWFDNKAPLRSGWAWGQHYLEGGTAAVEATLGKGKVFLFGPEITFRAQPHGTFKFLFNSIFYGTSTMSGTRTTTTTTASQQ